MKFGSVQAWVAIHQLQASSCSRAETCICGGKHRLKHSKSVGKFYTVCFKDFYFYKKVFIYNKL